MTYDPKADEHPVTPRLRTLGDLTLVGSRAFDAYHKFATAASDWDYYLSPAMLRHDSEDLHSIEVALKQLGFVRLKGEGGPYGADQAIYGIWRFEAHTAYGRDWPHVDVIVCSRAVAAVRLPVLARIANSGVRGGRLCRGLKAETSWGMFWWVQEKSA